LSMSVKLSSLNWLLLLLMQLTVASQANDVIPLSAEVSNPATSANKLGIDNVYRVLEKNGKQYFAGFSIDSAGINHPLLVEFDRRSNKQQSWHFDGNIADIFIYNSLVSVVLDDGKSFSLKKESWEPIPLILGQQSVVVFSDGQQHLIACSPASLSKADTRRGGCESFNPNWKIAFSWFEVTPSVCGNFLSAVTTSYKKNQKLKIDLDSGKVIDRKKFTGEIICTP
jgi:hypothetical protein